MKSGTVRSEIKKNSNRSPVRPRLLGRLAWLFVMLMNWTVRVCFVDKGSAAKVLAESNKVIYAFFHGDMVLLLHAYRNSGIVIPASESRDGDIMARLLKNFGFDVVRGSSKRNGHHALLELIRSMRKGKDAAISVDGPRGPLHEVKPGTLYLAGLLKVPIVPVAVAAKRSWVVEQSWDKLLVPAPFTRAIVLYGNPLSVSDTSAASIEIGRTQLQTELRRLKREARKAKCSDAVRGRKQGSAPLIVGPERNGALT